MARDALATNQSANSYDPIELRQKSEGILVRRAVRHQLTAPTLTFWDQTYFGVSARTPSSARSKSAVQPQPFFPPPVRRRLLNQILQISQSTRLHPKTEICTERCRQRLWPSSGAVNGQNRPSISFRWQGAGIFSCDLLNHFFNGLQAQFGLTGARPPLANLVL